jgi:hypothetical protein
VIDHTGRAVAWHDQARAQAWHNNIEGATKAGSSDASVPEAVHKVPSAPKPAYSPVSKSRQMSTFAPSLQPAAGSRSGIV